MAQRCGGGARATVTGVGPATAVADVGVGLTCSVCGSVCGVDVLAVEQLVRSSTASSHAPRTSATRGRHARRRHGVCGTRVWMDEIMRTLLLRYVGAEDYPASTKTPQGDWTGVGIGCAVPPRLSGISTMPWSGSVA